MALTLSLREGDDFYVGPERIRVTRVVSEVQVRVQRRDGAEFDLLDDRAVEVVPEAYVSLGDRPSHNMVRIVIDAPRSVRILRGTLKRENDRRGIVG